MKEIDFKRVTNFTITGLTILAWCLTGVGILLAAGLKKESVSSKILPHYDRYNLAMEAINIFDGEPQPVKRGNEPITQKTSGKIVMATVLSIDYPSWPVMLDFIKSDIAFRKSDRNQPTEESLSTEGESSDSPDTPRSGVLPEINFDRIKTIFVIRVHNVLKVGSKPLTEPYRTVVFWPPSKSRRVYDFYSFEEFRLDMKIMLVDELEYYSIIFTFIALVVTAILHVAKRYYRSHLKGKISDSKQVQ